jgi:hypothetical protein
LKRRTTSSNFSNQHNREPSQQGKPCCPVSREVPAKIPKTVSPSGLKPGKQEHRAEVRGKKNHRLGSNRKRQADGGEDGHLTARGWLLD